MPESLLAVRVPDELPSPEAEPAVSARGLRSILHLHPRLAKFGKWLATGTCLGFVGKRLIDIGPGTLVAQASWPLAFAFAGGTILFALADAALASAWSRLADPENSVSHCRLRTIYGRGVLAKYLPGSVFQYASRQLQGVGAGLANRPLARASAIEVGLHVPASLSAAGLILSLAQFPWTSGLVIPTAAYLFVTARQPIVRAAAGQLAAFAAFGGAALAIGAAVLGPVASLPLFGALFLLAWLAGFLVPVAPGGMGVREAVLIALAGGQFATAGLLAAVVALRLASVLGDVLFATLTLVKTDPQS